MIRVNVSSSTEEYFRTCLEFLKPVFKLRNRELDILGYLMYLQHQYDQIQIPEEAGVSILSFDNRIRICNKLHISRGILSNSISDLRKKGVLKGNSIDPKYLIRLHADPGLLINFTITDRKTSRR